MVIQTKMILMTDLKYLRMVTFRASPIKNALVAGAMVVLAGATTAPAVAQTAAIAPLAVQGETVLLPRLRGITLTNDQGKTQRGSGVEIADVDVPETATLLQSLSAAIGKPASFESLNRLVTITKRHFQDQGYPFTLVSLPEQDITSGRVRIAVQPTRLERPVRVTGAQYFAEDDYRKAVVTEQGGIINGPRLDKSMSRINANPFRQARIVASAGSKPGTTALTLEVKEGRPFNANAGVDYSSYDNKISPSLSATFGNAFGIGDLLRYDLGINTDNPGQLLNHTHSLTYTHYMDDYRTLNITGAFSRPEQDIDAFFRQERQSAQLSAIYEQQLPKSKNDDHLKWHAGLRISGEKTKLMFGGAAVQQSEVNIFHLSVGIDRDQKRDRGQLKYGAELILSPGGVLNHNSDADFDVARSGAKSRYAILKGNISWSQDLNQKWSWTIAARGQLASGALIQSQQFDAFSDQAVRAGDPFVYGDDGISVQNTLTFKPAKPLPLEASPYVFLDVAATRLRNVGAGVRASQSGIAVGIGASAKLSKKLILNTSLSGLRWQGQSSSGKDFVVSCSLNYVF